MDYKGTLLELLKDVSAWPDLKVKLETFNTSKTDKTEKNTVAGKLFEYFAKYYFKVDATQSQLYNDVWLYEEIDSLTKEELGLPNIDKGVDLLLKDTQGRYTVVQCKFKNNEESIVHFGKDKLANTFFWAKKCFGVILFTNVADCTDDIKNEKNFNAIKSDNLLNIDSSVFASIIKYIQSNIPPLVKKHEPLPHQELAITKVVKHFEVKDRGQLILPCGAGKTTTSLWIKESLKSKSTLVLFPSLALLRQFKTEWAEQRSEDYIYINICSEKDIDKNKDDSLVMHTYDISGEVTTSPDRVKGFLSSEFEQKIVFCTYQSIGVVQESLLQMPDFFFDLIICDEAHRTSGGAKKNTFAIVHDQTKIRGKKRLYMTATPRVVSVKLKAKLGEDYALLCDMSNPEIYGEEAFRMSFGEAITQNILVDYKIVGIGVTQKQVKQFIEQRRYVTEEYDLKEIADNYALNLVMDKYSASHAITFHSRVKFAEEFSKRHNSYFGPDVYSNHVSGEDKTSKRDDILRRFKNHDKGVVSNARCLIEGVDVPIIDLIYFCDPKNSKIDIVQASGRALRKDRHGKKPIGYIVVPIFHLINDDIEKEIENNPYFKNLIQVVRSLCDQDERLQAEIDDVAFNKGERISKRIEITYDDNEIDKIISIEGLDKEVKRYLFDQIIEKTKDSWNVIYANLVEFKKIYNTTSVTKKHTDFKNLNWWVQSQRNRYFEKRLSPIHFEKLTEIGFEWKGEQRREITDKFEIWMESYRKLEQYFSDNGNVNIPARYEKDNSLATWLVSQRTKYDNDKLTEKQIELLEKIKINWDPKNTYPQFVESITKYKSLFNHTRVPQGDDTYHKLAVKCTRVRTIKRNGKEMKNGDFVAPKKGRLTKWAIAKLNEIKFEWEIDTSDWVLRYEELKKYFIENGTSNIKAGGNASLVNWVYKQRKYKDDLSEEQIKKLNEIEFDFTLIDNETAFKNWLILLQNYFKVHNSFFILGSDFEKKPLKNWIVKLRAKYNNGKLKPEQIKELNEIGFSFSDISYEDFTWNENFQELVEYHNSNKSFILFDKPDLASLNRWLKFQRSQFRKGNLQIKREEELIKLGYSFTENYSLITDNRKAKISKTAWDKIFQEIRNYLDIFKSLEGIETKSECRLLYPAIKRIRRQFDKETLLKEKIEQLKEIGFDFTFSPFIERKKKTDNFEVRFEELKMHKSKTGTFYLTKENNQNKKLYSWVRAQKKLWNDGNLQPQRLERFNEIAYSFSESYKETKSIVHKEKVNDLKWNEKFELFKKYYEDNNTFYIQMTDKVNEKLRVWVQSQISNFRRKKLSPEKIDRLDSIGFRFETNQIVKPKLIKPIKEVIFYDELWNKQYLKLITYKIENGECNVRKSYEDATLGSWVFNQRKNRRQDKLSREKIEKLNLLGFRWDEVKNISEFEVWNKSYRKLKELFDKSAHSSPKKEDGDEQLISWVQQQRHKQRKGKLKKEYFDLLTNLKFDWNPDVSKENNTQWLFNYNKLIDYKYRFGTMKVSQTDKTYRALGRWINDQRVVFKKNKLSDFKIDKLNAIEFVWNGRVNK